MWTFEYSAAMKKDEGDVAPEVFKYEGTAPPVEDVWKRADESAQLTGCTVSSLRLKIYVAGQLFIDIEEPRERKLPTHAEAVEYLRQSWSKT